MRSSCQEGREMGRGPCCVCDAEGPSVGGGTLGEHEAILGRVQIAQGGQDRARVAEDVHGQGEKERVTRVVERMSV